MTSSKAARRLAADGPNLLPTGHVVPAWRRFANQLLHFFALMLWIAGALAFAAGMPQLGVAIFVVIVVNGTFAFAQEFRAERDAARLKDLLCQIGVAFTCRSATQWPGRLGWFSNRLLLVGVGAALALLVVLLFVPAVASVLGQAPPPPLAWAVALAGVPAMLGVDALHKSVRRRRARLVPHRAPRRGFTVLPTGQAHPSLTAGPAVEGPRGRAK